MTARRVDVTAQDFCNLLGGGMVSFSTLSPAVVVALSPLSIGSLLCSYTYSPSDRVEGTSACPSDAQHTFHMVCWRGATRAINVMCNKTDIEAIRHQIESLGVMRYGVEGTMGYNIPNMMRRERIGVVRDNPATVPVVTEEEKKSEAETTVSKHE